ncbi:MAG: DUF2207 domain-containing protein [Clostridiales bacterium]|nr:DUF2207 domain-containing protein [Clostridiales bacterium]
MCDSVGGFADEYGVYALFAAVFVIPVLGIFRVFRLIRRIRRRRSLKKFRNSPAQSPRYYRDLPDDRPAPAVDRLVHFYDGKSGLSRQISAALLELNLKKLVHFRTEAGETVLLLSEQPDGEHIPDYQELLWKFLLNAAVRALSPPLCKGRLHVVCREGGIVRCAYAGRLRGWLRCASHCLSSGTGFFREVFIMRRYTYPRAGGNGGKKQLSGFPRLIF